MARRLAYLRSYPSKIRSLKNVVALSELEVRAPYLMGFYLGFSVLYPVASYWEAAVCASKNAAAFGPGCI